MVVTRRNLLNLGTPVPGSSCQKRKHSRGQRCIAGKFRREPTRVQTPKRTSHTGNPTKAVAWAAIRELPPRLNSSCHGQAAAEEDQHVPRNVSQCSQSKTLSPLLKLVGIQNRDTPAAIAITASLTCLNGREPSSKGKGRIGEPKHHKITVITNTTNTAFSPGESLPSLRAHGQSTSCRRRFPGFVF